MEQHYDSNEEEDHHHELPSGFQGIDPEELANMDPSEVERLQQAYLAHMQEHGGEEYDDGEEGEHMDHEEYEGNEEEEEEEGHDHQGHSYEEENHEDGIHESSHYDKSMLKKSYTQQNQSDEYDLDDDFELIRKARRVILETVNAERKMQDLQIFHIDLMTNNIATEYSSYLKMNPHDPDFFNMLFTNYKGTNPSKPHEEVTLIHIISKYEEDVTLNQTNILKTFEDIANLLIESSVEKKILLDPKQNHLGLGIGFTEDSAIGVLIVSSKILSINRLTEISDNLLEIRGKVLDDQKYGIFAVKILNAETGKDIATCSPERIEFDRNSKEYIATLEVDQVFSGIKKNVELFVRGNPDSIPYKKQTREKIPFKHLTPALLAPLLVYPDPKFVEEDEEERKKFEDEIKQRKEAEEEKKKKDQDKGANNNKQRKDKKKGDDSAVSSQIGKEDKLDMFESQSGMNVESMNQEDRIKSQSETQERFKKAQTEQNKEQAISNKEIREELEIAIREAQKQHDDLMHQNYIFQENIKNLRNRTEMFVDKQGDVAMNEHKYLNTLAHVHQIRSDLKLTEERYNKMAYELQVKLEEKQKKCNEIKLAFMELKREVSKKAAFSRTDKPIPEKMIEEWEERELDKNKILQELRLEILRLRNNLAKNQKILKKKEELAEGLHLIDFEQLKIENQTLNEKIEERNEDLHKLKKKNTETVQILTHTKEKLCYVQEKNEELSKREVFEENELNDRRKDLTRVKKEKDEIRNKNLSLKQQTGIVNSKALTHDYECRKTRIVELTREKANLQEELEQMNLVIKQYEKSKEQDDHQVSKNK